MPATPAETITAPTHHRASTLNRSQVRAQSPAPVGVRRCSRPAVANTISPPIQISAPSTWVAVGSARVRPLSAEGAIGSSAPRAPARAVTAASVRDDRRRSATRPAAASVSVTA